MGMSPLRSFVFAICVGLAVWGFATLILKSATAEEPAQTTITIEDRASEVSAIPEDTEEVEAVENAKPTINGMIKVAIIFVSVALALMLAFTPSARRTAL